MPLMLDQRSPRLMSSRFESVDLTERAEISGTSTSNLLRVALYVDSHGPPFLADFL